MNPPYARLLGEHSETEHHDFRVTPNVMDLVPEMAALLDELCRQPRYRCTICQR